MKPAKVRSIVVPILVSLGVGACGGQSDGADAGAAFEPAVPPADPCALLSADDVATILPDADSGYPDFNDDTCSSTRWCTYFSTGSLAHFSVYVRGMFNETLWREAERGFRQTWGEGNVAGIGDHAHFFPDGGEPGDTPFAGTALVVYAQPYRVTTQAVDTPVQTQEALVAIVRKVLPELL